jgi:Domain of unknown function (DUF4160)
LAEQEAALSPTVLRKDGYRLYFFSREEPRVHVHAYCGDGEAKFWLEPQVELAYNHSLNRKQLREIEAIIDEHYQEIVDAWRDHFGN